VPEHGTLDGFTGKDVKGKDFDFASLKNKVVLIVNSAAKCGYTKDGYTNMTAIHDKLRDRGFEVLAFPCNQFGGQEPGTPEEITEFVCERFKGKFPLMEKADVNGEHEQPIYTWLKKSFPGDITWNFAAKFVVNHHGVPIARFETEGWDVIEAKIVEALNERDEEAVAEPAEEGAVAAAADEKAAAPAAEAPAKAE
jgi:glutathione peroxidase